jgi:hypothetical protein
MKWGHRQFERSSRFGDSTWEATYIAGRHFTGPHTNFCALVVKCNALTSFFAWRTFSGRVRPVAVPEGGLVQSRFRVWGPELFA